MVYFRWFTLGVHIVDFQSSIIILYMSDATAYYNAYFGESSGPYHLDDVYCNGYEANLLSCSCQYTTGGVYNNGIDIHNCAPGNEAGVKCDGMLIPYIYKAIVVCCDLEVQNIK